MGDLLLATAGEGVRLWTMPELNLHSVKNDGNVTCCTCSANGQMVAYTHEIQGINACPLFFSCVMGDVLLATAGEDVRLWTMPELNLHSVKNDGNVTCCTCSANGQMVAYTHEIQGIDVAFLQDDAPSLTIPTTCAQSNVSFSTNSRFLVSGGKDCTVHIWDIKSRTAKRTYKDHINQISFCIFNFNGNVVASASDQGEIILTEVQSGAPCQPMVGTDTQSITCLGYSHFTRYLLASTSNSGVLSLWDTKASKLVKSFMEHTAPSTCLSFSPLNDMLLCSTGLDKRINFYDVCYKKIVKTINADGPLTSCEFMHNGTTVAIGSEFGHISVFDLRHGSVPLRIVPGHRTAVKSVSFQKIPKERHPVKRPTEERGITTDLSDVQKSMVRSPIDISFDKTAIENQVKLTVNQTKSFQLEDIDTCSFEIQGNTEQSALQVNNDKSSGILGPSPHQKIVVVPSIPIDSIVPARKSVKREKLNLTQRDANSMVMEEEETISPSRSASSECNTSGLSRLQLLTRSSEDVFGSSRNKEKTYFNKKNERNSEDLLITKNNKDTDKDSVDEKKGVLLFKSPLGKKVDSGKCSDESETSSIDSVSMEDKTSNDNGRKNHNSDRSINFDSRSVGSNRNISVVSSSSLSTSVKNIDQTHFREEVRNPPIGMISGESQSSQLNSADNLSTYAGNVFHYGVPQTNISREFVEKMIAEAMEENRIAVHNDMVNLQVEFIRQMEIQKKQIQQMLEQYSVKDDLIVEILRLRVENKMLITKY